jgi:acetylornithine deacetylase/succinyl-diaminopimelate desuccinylase-like protein
VPNQDPARIVDLVATHAERNVPPGVRVYWDRLPFAAKPYFIPADPWGNEIAGRVLSEVYDRPPYFVRLGGSVPVCETFLTYLDAYTIGMGFALDDEQFHAPDEFLRLASFEKGQVAWGKLLQRLVDAPSRREGVRVASTPA